MVINRNGYIGKDGFFKEISKRFIGIEDSWKDQDFKFIGYNGYWRLIYTKSPINVNDAFYVSHLEGYTLGRENSLKIFGNNFKNFQLISPIGGYFELEKNGSDLFENFVSGSFVGAPQVGELLDGRRCMKIQSSLDYFQFPSDIDALGIFGSNGMKNYNISAWIYVDSLPTINSFIPVVSYGDRTNGMEIVITSEGRIQQKIWYSNSENIIQSEAALISIGWNSFVITRVNNSTKIYLNELVLPVVVSVQPMPVPLVNTPIKVGTSFKYTSTEVLQQAFSLSKVASKYTLSNSNLTVTTNASGAGTARSNNKIVPSTGKYYFEVKINNIAAGVIWVGLGDALLSQSSAVGIAGWSISSNSRTFNKQTGGGTNWGSGLRTFTTNDIIGCVYDSDNGTATFYKNNVLLGVSTSSITGDVEFMVAGDINTSATIRIKSADWTYSPPSATAIQMPEAITYSGLVNYSVVGNGYKYVYISNNILSDIDIKKLLKRDNPVVVLEDKLTSHETIIPEDWILKVANESISLTIPPQIDNGLYNIFIKYFDSIESYKFPVKISDPIVETESFFDDFTNPDTLRNNYRVMNRAWGGANGGVVPENVFIRDGELVLRANGDNYLGEIQGVDRNGVKKNHTELLDPKYGLPWTTRVGGCLVYDKRTGFGSYEIDTLIPNQLGVAYAMWTFFYNEVYPTDPRYSQFTGDAYEEIQNINITQSGFTINNIIDDYGIISYGTNYDVGDKFIIDQDPSQTVYTCIGTEPSVIYYNPTTFLSTGNTFSKVEITSELSKTSKEGLHEQGNLESGVYVVRNHEIDIEFPSHLEGNTLNNPSLSNMKCNTWRGELKNWNVSSSDSDYWEEYRDNLTSVGFNIADGNYHKLRFDWYPDRVEFYIDGILKQVNTNTDKGDSIPDISGFFSFGVWFPSSPLADKPWLVNPLNAWAGGVIDQDGGMKADFDSIEMKVRSFKFTPFNQYNSLQRNLGETYPFGGFVRKNSHA